MGKPYLTLRQRIRVALWFLRVRLITWLAGDRAILMGWHIKRGNGLGTAITPRRIGAAQLIANNHYDRDWRAPSAASQQTKEAP